MQLHLYLHAVMLATAVVSIVDGADVASLGVMPLLLSTDALVKSANNVTVANVFVAEDNSTLTAFGDGVGDVACVFHPADAQDAYRTPAPLRVCQGGPLYLGASYAADLFTVACDDRIVVLRCGTERIEAQHTVLTLTPSRTVAVAEEAFLQHLVVASSTAVVVYNQSLVDVTRFGLPVALVPPVSTTCDSSCWVVDANGTAYALSLFSDGGLQPVISEATDIGFRGPVFVEHVSFSAVVVASGSRLAKLTWSFARGAAEVNAIRYPFPNSRITAIAAAADSSVFVLGTVDGLVIRFADADSVPKVRSLGNCTITEMAFDLHTKQLYVAAFGDVTGAVIGPTSVWTSTSTTPGQGHLLTSDDGSPMLCVPPKVPVAGYVGCTELYPPRNLDLPSNPSYLYDVIRPLRLFNEKLYALSTRYSFILMQVFDVRATVVATSNFSLPVANSTLDDVVVTSDGRLFGTVVTSTTIEIQVVVRGGQAPRVVMVVPNPFGVQTSQCTRLWIIQESVVMMEAYIGGVLTLLSLDVTTYGLRGWYNFTNVRMTNAALVSDRLLVILLSDGDGLLTFDPVEGQYNLGPQFPQSSQGYTTYPSSAAAQVSPDGRYVGFYNAYWQCNIVFLVWEGSLVYASQFEEEYGFAFAPDGGYAACLSTGGVAYRFTVNFSVAYQIPNMDCIGNPVFIGSDWYQTVAVPVSGSLSGEGEQYQHYIARVTYPIDYTAIPAVFVFSSDSTFALQLSVYSASEQIAVFSCFYGLFAVDLRLGTLLWGTNAMPALFQSDSRVAAASLPGAVNCVFTRPNTVLNLFTGEKLETLPAALNQPVRHVVSYNSTGGFATLNPTGKGMVCSLYTNYLGVWNVTAPSGFRPPQGPHFPAGPNTTLPIAAPVTSAPRPIARVPPSSPSVNAGAWAGIVVGVVIGSAILGFLGKSFVGRSRRTSEYQNLQGSAIA